MNINILQIIIFLESDSENIVLSEFENCVNIVNDKKLNDCHNISTKPLYALILTPTRELAIQIKNHLTQAVKYTDIKVRLFFSKSTDLLNMILKLSYH